MALPPLEYDRPSRVLPPHDSEALMSQPTGQRRHSFWWLLSLVSFGILLISIFGIGMLAWLNLGR